MTWDLLIALIGVATTMITTVIMPSPMFQCTDPIAHLIVHKDLNLYVQLLAKLPKGIITN